MGDSGGAMGRPLDGSGGFPFRARRHLAPMVARAPTTESGIVRVAFGVLPAVLCGLSAGKMRKGARLQLDHSVESADASSAGLLFLTTMAAVFGNSPIQKYDG